MVIVLIYPALSAPLLMVRVAVVEEVEIDDVPVVWLVKVDAPVRAIEILVPLAITTSTSTPFVDVIPVIVITPTLALS